MASRSNEYPAEDFFASRMKWMRAFVSIAKDGCMDAVVDVLGGKESDYYISTEQNHGTFTFKLVLNNHVEYKSNASPYNDDIRKSAEYAVIWGFNWGFRAGWKTEQGKKVFKFSPSEIYESAYGMVAKSKEKIADSMQSAIAAEKEYLDSGADLEKEYGTPRMPSEYDFTNISARGSVNRELNAKVERQAGNRKVRVYKYDAEENRKDMSKPKTFRFERPISGGDIESVRQMLDQGMDPNKLVSGNSPLHVAVARGRVKIMELLLKRGADVNINVKSKNWTTPLHMAAFEAIEPTSSLDWGKRSCRPMERKTEETLKFLLRNGADASLKNKNGMNPIEYVDYYINECGISPDDPEIRKLKNILGGGLKESVNEGRGKMSKFNGVKKAIEKNDIHGIRQMLDEGLDPNAVNRSGNTPLIIAAACGRLGIVDLLIEHGADVNARAENTKMTPLHAVAVSSDNPQSVNIAKTLMLHEAQVDVADKEGFTPSDLASGRNGTALKKLFEMKSSGKSLPKNPEELEKFIKDWFDNQDPVRFGYPMSEEISMWSKKIMKMGMEGKLKGMSDSRDEVEMGGISHRCQFIYAYYKSGRRSEECKIPYSLSNHIKKIICNVSNCEIILDPLNPKWH